MSARLFPLRTPAWIKRWSPAWTKLQAAWGRWAMGRRRRARLRLADCIALGDRRSAGILEVEGRRFLIASTPQAVTLLAELEALRGSFAGRASADESADESAA